MSAGKKRGTPAKNETARFFAALGARIRNAWRRAGYDGRRIVEIACNELDSAAVCEHLGYTDIIDWVARADKLPPQNLTSGFGQPPLTVFRDKRFRIDALFWRFETTAIHQHAFAGAFTVLAGSSVHCSYSFAAKRKVSSGFVIGKLDLTSVELIRAGAVRPIEPGGTIHSVFHLETPTVTIVVGTVPDSRLGPEYTYYAPSIALDPSNNDARRTRRLQLLEMLAAVHHKQFEAVALEILEHCDLQTAFLVLAQVGSRPAAFRERMVAAASARHGGVIAAIMPAISEEHRRKRLFALRRETTDPEQRLLLALLLTFPNRPTIDAFLRAQFPNTEPPAFLERLVLALSRTGQFGFSFDELLTRLLRACLQATSDEELLTRLHEEGSQSTIRASTSDIREACRLLKANTLLAPLFRFGDGSRSSAFTALC